MKQKVLVCAGSSAFEFEGEILELEPDYLVLRAKHGDIYIERKYLVFIQFLNEEKEPEPAPVVKPPKSPQADAAARFVNKRLKHDPVDDTFEEMIMPPSQLRDDDVETVQQIERLYGKPHPITQAENLADAVRNAMNGGDEDFSMGTGGSQYNNPAQTILGRKNANNKKS